MKWARITAGTGAIMAVMGVVFHLQGRAVVGPEHSFMHSNPDWVTFGIIIAIAGVMALAIGMAMLAKRR